MRSIFPQGPVALPVSSVAKPQLSLTCRVARLRTTFVASLSYSLSFFEAFSLTFGAPVAVFVGSLAASAVCEEVSHFSAGASAVACTRFYLSLGVKAKFQDGWNLSLNLMTYFGSANTLTGSDGATHLLGVAEAEVLRAFLLWPHQILNREHLLAQRDLSPADRTIDVRISRLRKRLEADPQNPKIIKTVYGAGYMFMAQVSWR